MKKKLPWAVSVLALTVHCVSLPRKAPVMCVTPSWDHLRPPPKMHSCTCDSQPLSASQTNFLPTLSLCHSVHLLCLALAGFIISPYTPLPSYLFLSSSSLSATLTWLSKDAKTLMVSYVSQKEQTCTHLFQHLSQLCPSLNAFTILKFK